MMNTKNEVESVQAESEATKDTELPEQVRGSHKGRAVVQSVRLPEAEFAEIEQMAADLDVPVSALIRGWVLAGLAAERDTSLRSAIERLAGDAERLRRIASQSGVA